MQEKHTEVEYFFHGRLRENKVCVEIRILRYKTTLFLGEKVENLQPAEILTRPAHEIRALRQQIKSTTWLTDP
jgi:hypothetical protein